jgi:glycerophosphoryl diester phosphodiesterase
VLAHRGACKRARENTLEAFAIARELGADGVELDVRRTRDHTLVVHHDAELDGIGVIASVDFAELHAAAPWLPTLEEALDELHGLVVNVEIKCLPTEPDADVDGSVVEAVVRMLATRDSTEDFVVSSFDPAAVDRVRSLDPRLSTGILAFGLDPTFAEAMHTTIAGGHGWYHPYWQTLLAHGAAASIAACHDAGVRVDVWTLDEPAPAAQLAAAGVDAIITNVPDVILPAVGR